MIAEIDYFVTALLPVIESEPGKLGHLVVSFREPSMSMEYNTEDGITILAGVGRARSYVEVGACSVDPNESWDFDATAPVQVMSAYRLKRLLEDCRDHERRRASAFLIYWEYRGSFLDAARQYDVMSPAEQKAFEHRCKQERRAYI